MNECDEYLTEYQWLKQIPLNEWLLFVGLKYQHPPESNRIIFKDVQQWLENISRPIGLKSDQLLWFGRIEDKKENGKSTMIRHVHLCLHRTPFDVRFKKCDGKPWDVEKMKMVLTMEWETRHGGCFVDDYDPKFTARSGVGYCLKRESEIEDVFISKKLLKKLRTKETTI